MENYDLSKLIIESWEWKIMICFAAWRPAEVIIIFHSQFSIWANHNFPFPILHSQLEQFSIRTILNSYSQLTDNQPLTPRRHFTLWNAAFCRATCGSTLRRKPRPAVAPQFSRQFGIIRTSKVGADPCVCPDQCGKGQDEGQTHGSAPTLAVCNICR